MEIKDDGRMNPVIVISADEFMDWVRQKADEAGYADRQLCLVQASIEGDDMLLQGPIQIAAMVSNIKDSR